MAEEEELLHLVAKYFFFTCLDENLTFAASLKALQEIKSNRWVESSHRPQWITVLQKWKSRLPTVRPRKWTAHADKPGFQIPAGVGLSNWISFLTDSSPEESDAVILSRVLNFSDQEIADGLKITAGTVRYRVGRGLRQLGGFVES